MTAFEIVVAAYLAVIPPVLGALFVRRFDRLEQRFDRMEDRLDELAVAVARRATREELENRFGRMEDRFDRTEDRFDGISGAIALCATREEMGELRRETAALRSDLTQVALAVGARPRASEA